MLKCNNNDVLIIVNGYRAVGLCIVDSNIRAKKNYSKNGMYVIWVLKNKKKLVDINFSENDNHLGSI